MSRSPSTVPLVLAGSNLSHVWARALWHIAKASGGEIKPLVITIDGFEPNGMPQEDAAVRKTLDAFLSSHKKWSVEIVGFTIFPQRYLQVSSGNRHELYEMYNDALPHIKARNPRLNSRGLYFERLIDFGGGKFDGNQLEFIIKEHSAGRDRASKFQAAIYDPRRDQSRQPYQTFPCLQTVSFVPTDEGLVVNGFYAMQYVVQKAYGNLLGLSHLGAFMAKEMKMPLRQLNVVAGVEKLEFTKKEIHSLLSSVEKHVPELTQG